MACKVKAELEAAFKKLDANGDGYVTATELQNFMVTLDAYKTLSKDKVKEASAVRSLNVLEGSFGLVLVMTIIY